MSQFTINETDSLSLNTGPPSRSDELLSLNLEGNRHDRAFWPAREICCFLIVATDLSEPRALEDGGVKLRCLFRPIVELREWTIGDDSFLSREFDSGAF